MKSERDACSLFSVTQCTWTSVALVWLARDLRITLGRHLREHHIVLAHARLDRCPG